MKRQGKKELEVKQHMEIFAFNFLSQCNMGIHYSDDFAINASHRKSNSVRPFFPLLANNRKKTVYCHRNQQSNNMVRFVKCFHCCVNFLWIPTY